MNAFGKAFQLRVSCHGRNPAMVVGLWAFAFAFAWPDFPGKESIFFASLVRDQIGWLACFLARLPVAVWLALFLFGLIFALFGKGWRGFWVGTC